MRRLVVCGAFAAAALTACGSPQEAANQQTLSVAPSSSSASGSSEVSMPPASSTPSAADGVEAQKSTRCTAGSLDGKVQPTDAGAGNRHGKLVVTNTGGTSCTLRGYSGLQLLDSAGNPLPTNLQRTTDPAPALITLAPGAAAAANLHWSVVPTGNEPVDKPCQPDAASAAAIPPDETRPMTLSWGLGPVCAGGKIEISAFYAA